jgi:hypothetical protein
MIIDMSEIVAYQFEGETVHATDCATPEEVSEATLDEILTNRNLEQLEDNGKACFCDRCKERIKA